MANELCPFEQGRTLVERFGEAPAFTLKIEPA